MALYELFEPALERADPPSVPSIRPDPAQDVGEDDDFSAGADDGEEM